MSTATETTIPRLKVQYREEIVPALREQFAYDIHRRARLRLRGYRVVQIEASMMRSPRGVVLFIASDMRQRGWSGEPQPAAVNRALWPARRRAARKW